LLQGELFRRSLPSRRLLGQPLGGGLSPRPFLRQLPRRFRPFVGGRELFLLLLVARLPLPFLLCFVARDRRLDERPDVIDLGALAREQLARLFQRTAGRQQPLRLVAGLLLPDLHRQLHALHRA